MAQACNAREGEHCRALPRVGVQPKAANRAAAWLDGGGGTTASGYNAKKGRGGMQRAPMCSLAPLEHRTGTYHGKTMAVVEINGGAELGGGVGDFELYGKVAIRVFGGGVVHRGTPFIGAGDPRDACTK